MARTKKLSSKKDKKSIYGTLIVEEVPMITFIGKKVAIVPAKIWKDILAEIKYLSKQSDKAALIDPKKKDLASSMKEINVQVATTLKIAQEYVDPILWEDEDFSYEPSWFFKKARKKKKKNKNKNK